MKNMVNRIYTLIRVEKPNCIVFEDVRVYNNAHTTITLSKVLGTIIGKCIDLDIPYECYGPSEWREKHGLQENKRKTEEYKKLAIELVREKYNSDVDDNEAEAILIGASWYM